MPARSKPKSKSKSQPKSKSYQQKTHRSKKKSKLCITLINGQGLYSMYVIPGSAISDSERIWCQNLQKDGKNQTKLLQWTRLKLGNLAQIRLNFLSKEPKTPCETIRLQFLQSLYKKDHSVLYKDVGKWAPFVRRQPVNVFVLRDLSLNPSKINPC